MDKKEPSAHESASGRESAPTEPLEEDWREIFTCLHDEHRFSYAEIGAMTRREIAWSLEMAAEKMRRRGMRVGKASSVDGNEEFTEKEGRLLDSELPDAQERLRARFKKHAQK